MSYHFDIIARTDDRAAALADFHAFFVGRNGYWTGPGQYSFSPPNGEEGCLFELIEEEDFDDVDTEDEEDPRTVGWVSINFFRSEAFYVAVAQELVAFLAYGKFVLSDPEDGARYTSDFPADQFVAFMASVSLD